MATLKNGKKVIPCRQTTAELRVRLIWLTLKAMFECLCQYGRYIWEHNPLKVLSRRHRRLYFVENYGEIMIKPKFGERLLDLLLTDYRRRQRLLYWVHSRIGSHTNVYDFSSSWQDGTALCALLEYICPGVCPSFHLLSGHNRVKNCRLGLKLANKYLYVPMDLISAEEMAIANKSTENKIIQYISMVKWASQNIKEKWASLHESLIAAKTGRCFAKGSGLKSGIVGKRSKFTVLVSDTIGVFNLLIEVRGPNNEYCGERMVSLHQAKALLDKSFDFDIPQSDNIKYLEDCASNTFVRKKIPPRYDSNSTEPIYFDIQSGEEGTFYMTFVPRIAGMHAVAVKWQNHHVENSPFRIKVYKASNVSAKNLKGAQEKRVIYDSLSLSSSSTDVLDHPDGIEETVASIGDGTNRSISAIAKAKAYSKGRQLTVTRRRVLRRIITRNGEDIVIEEAISPSISRQSSITDNSDEETRHQRQEKDEQSLADPHIVKPKASILRTVPEERGSKDGEHSNSIDQSSHGVKYKCTELDEHNRLDDSGIQKALTYGSTEKEELLSSQPNPESEPTLFEKYGRNTGMVAKRSILKRTASIHHPYKQQAKRTSSDGMVYKLRRGMVSVASFDMSDTSSEVSSDEKKVDPVEKGDTSPALKLLHSSSMKKACLYISEKAMHQQTMSSGGDSESINDETVDSCTSLPGKTKLRATQSLPLMRKYWKRDMTCEDSIKGLIKSLHKISSLNSLQDSDKQHFCVIKSLDRSDTLTNSKIFEKLRSSPYENEPMPETPSISLPETDSNNSPLKQHNPDTPKDLMFSFGSLDTKSYNVELDKLKEASKISPPEITEVRSTENYVPDTPSGLSQRGNLTRQTKIFCRKSSADSSSVKTDQSIDEKTSTSHGSESKNNRFCAFRRIYIQSDEEHKVVGKKEVTVIIPKAKVDKCTQVTHYDITRETGLDLIEGVYLLLRKISINLPSQLSDAPKPLPKPLTIPVVDSCDKENQVSAGNELPDKNLLQVPLSHRNDHKYPQRPPRLVAMPDDSNVPESPEVRDQQEFLRRENHRNVNAWFERNNQLNSPNRLAPIRQFTIETVDSGFDDSQMVAHYNRQGRLSLPSVLSENGHVRLHRRPYRGPNIVLAPSLVNSNSSQSVSLDIREAGNEADDELPQPNIQPDTPRQPTRKRRRRINRADSFSLSDSELQERRKRMAKRNLSFDHTSSSNGSFFGQRKDFSEVMKKIMKQTAALGHFRENCVRQSKKSNGNENRLTIKQENTTKNECKVEPKASPRKSLKQGQGTLTSVDSNYCGFGISKANRSDFLFEVDGFQNLCLAEEIPDENLSPPKITHWQDENVFIPYSDDNAEAHEDSECLIDRQTSETSEHESDAKPQPIYVSENHNIATLENVEDNAQHKHSIENIQIVPRQPSQEMIMSSRYFDMFSSFDHSNLQNDVEPSDIAMLGDVISLATTSGGQTIFRLAGAGLRYGTVGENNSFQVWVENPTPGSLMVTVSGPQPHSVTETSVVYTGDSLYEVSYGVTHPGQYKIYVSWGDRQLSTDPYICEVTV